MSYRDQIKKQIEYIEHEIANSKTKNLELENQLLKLKLTEFEEEMREETSSETTLLKG